MRTSRLQRETYDAPLNLESTASFSLNFLIFLLFLAAGCSINSGVKVRDWPYLMPVLHMVGSSDLRDRCLPHLPSFDLFMSLGVGIGVEACAEFRLSTRECHIWVSSDFPPQRIVVDHEYEHCQGYDHVGASSMCSMVGSC